jgi:hypothetical protein
MCTAAAWVVAVAMTWPVSVRTALAEGHGRLHTTANIAVQPGQRLARDHDLRIGLIAECPGLFNGNVLCFVCRIHPDHLRGSRMIDKFKTLLRKDIHEGVFHDADIRLFSMISPPPGIPLIPDILFCDHDHGPGFMHLAEKDTDGREVIVQFA